MRPALELPEALMRDPANLAAAAKLSREVLGATAHDEAAQVLMDLITHHEPFQTALAVELVKLEGPGRLRSCLEALPSPPVHDLTSTVRALLSDAEIAPAELELFGGASPAAQTLSTLLWDDTRYLPFDEHATRIAGEHARDFLASPIFDLDPALVARIDGLNFASEALRESFLRSERLGAFQTYALRTDTLAVNDPHTGEPAEYRGYFAHWNRFVYRFQGATTFYLVAGGVAGFIRGLYLPDDDAFLYFDSIHAIALDTWRVVKPALADALLAARRRTDESTDADATTTDGRPRRVVARVGGPENFAHVLWNSLGALERERGLGTLSRLRHLRSLASDYFGPLADLYPELAGAEIVKLRHGGIERDHVSDGSQVLVPLGSVLIFPEAMARVARLADRHLGDPQLKSIRGRLRRCPNRLYVALRVGDKAWADAEVEVPKLINRMLAAHPDAAVILDGFSVPSGTDYITKRWQSQLDELRAMVATIRSRVDQPDRVIDIMGLDLLRSIAVLRTATCYLAPIGTAHHKVDWMTDIPGIVYVSQEYDGHLPFDEWAGLEQRLGSHTPRPVVGQDLSADAIRKRRSDDRRLGLANFTLSAEVVWRELEPLLAEAPVGPQRPLSGIRRLLARGRR